MFNTPWCRNPKSKIEILLPAELFAYVFESGCKSASPVTPSMAAISDTVFVWDAQFSHFDVQHGIAIEEKVIVATIDPEAN